MELVISFIASWIIKKVLRLVFQYVRSYWSNKKHNKTEGERGSRVMAFVRAVLEDQLVEFLKEVDFEWLLEIIIELLI
ncbi:TPA: hypothetical protein ACX6SP_000375 [Photobacterium damselae]